MKIVESDASDDDLHAYVDGRLDEAGRLRVERIMAVHPDIAARVGSWQSSASVLRQALDWKAAERVAPSLTPNGLAALRAARTRAPRRAMAGLALALLIGAGAGWVAHGPRQNGAITAFGLEAAGVHQAFAAANNAYPQPLASAGTAQLVDWARQRLGRPIAAPDLSGAGYALLGGSLVATPHGSGCMFLYQDAGHNRITVFMRPMQQVDGNAPMQKVGQDTASGFAWVRHGLGVSLISTASSPELHRLSDTVRAQLDAGA